MCDDWFDSLELEEIVALFEEQSRANRSPSIDEYLKKHASLREPLASILPSIQALESAKAAASDGRQLGSPIQIEQLGEFKIVREIGRGGMGVVFEAVQESLSRRVAVKVLPANILTSDTALTRFEREARTVAQFHHSNIVTVLDVGQQDGLHFYAMPLIEGTPLDQMLAGEPESKSELEFHLQSAKNCGAYFKSIARIGVQVADALDYSHRRGVLHRDIKPSNLLLQADGKVWVTDFGVSKAFDDMAVSKTGEIVGTPRYMAPEQFRGRSKKQSDVYNLGVTLFELAAQCPADKICPDLGRPGSTERLPHLRQVNSAVPKDLDAIVFRATAPDINQRYESAALFAADLQRFLFGQPVLSNHRSTFTKVWTTCRHYPAMTGLSSLAIGLGLVVLTLLAVGYYRERTHRQQMESALALSIEALEQVYQEFEPDTIRDLSLPLDDQPKEWIDEQSAGRDQLALAHSIRLLEKLMPLYDQVAAKDLANSQRQFQAAQARRRLGDRHFQVGNLERAESLYLAAAERLRKHLGSFPNAQLKRELGQVWMNLGTLNYRQHRVAEGDDYNRKVISLLANAGTDGVNVRPSNPELRFSLASAYFHLGTVPRHDPSQVSDTGSSWRLRKINRDRLQERLPYLDKAMDLLDELNCEFPDSARCLHLRALCFRERSRRPGDVDSQESIALLHQLVKRFPSIGRFRLDLCETYAAVHPPRLDFDQYAGAMEQLESAIRLAEELDLRVTFNRMFLAHTHHKLASIQVRSKVRVEASKRDNFDADQPIQNASRALEYFESTLSGENPSAISIVWRNRFRRTLALALLNSGRAKERDQVRAIVRESLDDLESLKSFGEKRICYRFMVKRWTQLGTQVGLDLQTESLDQTQLIANAVYE